MSRKPGKPSKKIVKQAPVKRGPAKPAPSTPASPKRPASPAGTSTEPADLETRVTKLEKWASSFAAAGDLSGGTPPPPPPPTE